MKNEAKALLFCPGCNAAKVPALGGRCETVRGAPCGVRRCWRCAALNRRRLRCGFCGAIQPLELASATVEVEGHGKFSRNGSWPARQIKLLIDHGGTGLVWVQSTAWAQLRDSAYTTRRVLEAVVELQPLSKHELVGPYSVARGLDPAAIRSSWSAGRRDVVGKFMADVGGRCMVLALSAERARPYHDVKALPPQVSVPVSELVAALRLATLQVHEVYGPPRAISVCDDAGRSLSVRERLASCEDVLAKMARRLIADDRARLDIGDVDVLALDLLLGGNLSAGVRECWPPGEVWGLAFCGGSLCPGLSWFASRNEPHPESCLGPGEQGDDVVEVPPTSLLSSLVCRGRRLELDLGHRSPFSRGLTGTAEVDEAEAARRDQEGLERTCPLLRRAG